MGTRGDVQPLVALGKGLKSAGNSITVATHEEFEPLVRETGLGFYQLRGLDPKKSVHEITGKAPRHFLGQSQIVQMAQMARLILNTIPEIGESCREACQGADLCIANLIPPAVPPSVCEKLGIPCMFAMLQPVDPTGEFPNMFVSARSLGKTGNYLTYRGLGLVVWEMIKSPVNRWRKQYLCLPPLKGKDFLEVFNGSMPRLYGFSPTVIPKPREWSDSAVITGYWFLDQASGWQPPEELTEFLQSGPPPVSIGFGSMVAHDNSKIAEICIEALSRARQRGIFLTGWGGLPEMDLPDSFMAVESVPHEWLFSCVSAVVHHGGAGTTAAGLRAGIPAVTVPFLADQSFWGKRIHDLGVGPKPIPRRKLTAERLSAAVTEAVTNPGLRRRAVELGMKIRTEDGVNNAVGMIHRFMKQHPGPPGNF